MGIHHHYIRDKVPAGFRDPVSTQHVKTGMLYGTTLKNSPTFENKPPGDEILLHGHGRLIRHNKKRHYYGGGMGANSTTRLIFPPRKKECRTFRLGRIGQRGFAGENRSYANCLAHDQIIDTNHT